MSTTLTALPAGYLVRPANEDDLEGWLTVTRLLEVHELGAAESTWADVREEWGRPGFDLGSDAWVAIDGDGRIVGFTHVWAEEPTKLRCDGYVLPELNASAVEEHLIDLAEARCTELRSALSGEAEVNAGWVNVSSNGERAALLERRGYRIVRTFIRMGIELDGPRPQGDAPEGIKIRPVDPAVDLDEVYRVVETAFQDHWGFTPTPKPEFRRRFVEREDYDPSLWFLAEVDGRAVGAVMAFKEGEDGGWVKELGVLREARGRGIGVALLERCFAEFAERGWTNAQLGVDSDNPTGAVGLYQRAGMTERFRFDFWRREL